MEDMITYLGVGMVAGLYSITAIMVALELGSTYRELFTAFYR